MGKALHKHQLLHVDNASDVWAYTVSMGSPRRGMDIKINRTGIWLMVISNCGHFDTGFINGNVTAKHAYGYLPANEVYKMPFYAGLGIVYGIMAAIWGGLCARWAHVLFHIQYCILGVVLLGLLEGGLWLVFFHHFNQTAVPL